MLDYLGPGVKTAFKLAQKAGKGLIMVGPEVYAKAMASVQRIDAFNMRSLGSSVITKNSDPVSVYEVKYINYNRIYKYMIRIFYIFLMCMYLDDS